MKYQNIVELVNNEIELLQNENQALMERIKEFKALQAPKTCYGCTYEKCELDTPLHDLYCANCSRIHVDNYEPKEQS